MFQNDKKSLLNNTFLLLPIKLFSYNYNSICTEVCSQI